MTKARIFPPSKNPMQSGHGNRRGWRLELEQPTRREPEPLMGWTRGGDTLNQVVLRFDSCAEAVAFAELRGWEYTVLKARARRVRPRNYADNFKYVPGEESRQ
ncbi:MAG: oxidoreductase [Alphaproteobacteria bacterium]|nr:oxidoreductase [Alphaproteobacteria bacterium]